MMAFWTGLWRTAPGNRALRLTSGLMLGLAALGLLAFPFPMRTSEVPGAITVQTIILGVPTPLLMLAGIGSTRTRSRPSPSRCQLRPATATEG
jgi:hypothetical protein